MSPLPRTRPLYTPLTAPPQGVPPSAEILVEMGERGVFEMLEDVYHELESSSIRPLFPEDMLAASHRSAAFFVQILGGKPLYSERYGPPRMRQKHEPFEIDAAARAVWLGCFDKVLAVAEARYRFPREHLADFREFLEGFSGWMVNAE